MFSFIKSFFTKYCIKKQTREKEIILLKELLSTAENEYKVLSENSKSYISWKIKFNDLYKKSLNSSIKKYTKSQNFTLLQTFAQSFQQKWNTAQNKIEELQHKERQVALENAKNIIGTIKGHALDKQQLDCTIDNSHNVLVLAGAGTGKTTTIVGKVKYLIKTGFCKPEEILLLSYTNKSVEDLEVLLQQNVSTSLKVLTFHKLGKSILDTDSEKHFVCDDKDATQIIKNILQEKLKEKQYLKQLNHYILYNKRKFDKEFKTLEEYKNYLQKNPIKTLKGEFVKSYGEMHIANFLFQNRIQYEYERCYAFKTSTKEFRQYAPDFYLKDYDIYIEYFAIDRKNQVPAYFSSRKGLTASETYLEGMKWKRETHKKFNTKLIECFVYEHYEGELLNHLETKLKKEGVTLKPMTAEEMWHELSKKHFRLQERIANLFERMLKHIKENGYSLEDVHTLNKKAAIPREEKQDNENIIRLFSPVYNAYQNKLKENGKIDFNDMIRLAIQKINDKK